MRLFVAIALAPEVIVALHKFSQSLRSAGDELRWTSPETWHITLQFLGVSSVESYECAVRRLREIKSPQVPVRVHGTGVFDRAGVFWAGVNVSPELGNLEKQVVAATAKCGFATEDRPYHPHVTLARAKGDDRVRALRRLHGRLRQEMAFPPFTASEFLLFESFTGSGGAKHVVRERFAIGMES